ncbi:MAG: hypothetical protein K940chlam1_01164 [Candidatus Anoxychlamydiales bacterium]|nr:hypothetical protein [Candidatus Anoxychlamydiales bacterium]NGX35813.1 hypothetical protein [Candidatus Anoxychlamydiales bacterium]
MSSNPRIDESSAIKKLCDYLNIKFHETVYEPNGVDTAPDYLINFNSCCINVEVRNSGSGFILLPNSQFLESREQYDISSINMTDKIEKILKNWLQPSETIILTFNGPIAVEKRGKLAKKIAKNLEKAYRKGGLKIDQKIEIKVDTYDSQIPSLTLGVILTNFYADKINYSPLHCILDAVADSSNSVFQASLTEQAKYILYKAITEKQNKLGKIEGDKWLVIINNHISLNHHIYNKGYDKLIKENQITERFFEKIFLIVDDKIEELERS